MVIDNIHIAARGAATSALDTAPNPASIAPAPRRRALTRDGRAVLFEVRLFNAIPTLLTLEVRAGSPGEPELSPPET